jgi:hypothetical protein
VRPLKKRRWRSSKSRAGSQDGCSSSLAYLAVFHVLLAALEPLSIIKVAWTLNGTDQHVPMGRNINSLVWQDHGSALIESNPRQSPHKQHRIRDAVPHVQQLNANRSHRAHRPFSSSTTANNMNVKFGVCHGLSNVFIECFYS